MNDLIDAPRDGENAPEFSVSEISGIVKRMIEGEFSHIRIKGEVGRVSRPASGHLYMDLKDDRAVLSAVIWKGTAAKLRTMPEEGMEVVATGRLTTFPGQSRYQMIIEHIAPAGVGALMAMLEKRKQALAQEGLFDQVHKKGIPYLPEVIGVITSPSGAVIRDILHRLRDRFPRKVLIWPAAVQGEKCAPEIVAGIEGFNAFTVGGALPRPELIIVARGGGSLEDLWGFNEEVVVRAAAASDIPLISAVGHETDTTLIDFASDVRAPTPTAAAELAVPVRSDLIAALGALEERRRRAAGQGIALRRQRLRDLSRALPNAGELVAFQTQRLDVLAARVPRALIGLVTRGRSRLMSASAGLRPARLRQNLAQKTQELTSFGGRFEQAAKSQIERQRTRLTALERLRETLGYKATLRRGYAVVRDSAGHVVPTKSAAVAASGLSIEFQDGDITMDGRTGAKKAAKKKPSDPQGNLF
ncbi:MAG: exodeoxyribonuclease VII large subunit [Pseudomonadota bacterium]